MGSNSLGPKCHLSQPHARCQWAQEQTLLSHFSATPNLIPLSHAYLQMQEQQFSLTQINSALNTAPFALYPPPFLSLPRLDHVRSPVPPRNIFVSKLHSCEALQLNPCLRVSPSSISRLYCLPNVPPNQLLNWSSWTLSHTFGSLQPPKSVSATLSLGNERMPESHYCSKSRRTNRLKVLQTVCIASKSVQAEDNPRRKQGLLILNSSFHWLPLFNHYFTFWLFYSSVFFTWHFRLSLNSAHRLLGGCSTYAFKIHLFPARFPSCSTAQLWSKAADISCRYLQPSL